MHAQILVFAAKVYMARVYTAIIIEGFPHACFEGSNLVKMVQAIPYNITYFTALGLCWLVCSQQKLTCAGFKPVVSTTIKPML